MWKRPTTPLTPIYNTENPLFSNQMLYPTVDYEEMAEAIVEDIILNEDHPLYDKNTGYEVGAIKFRLINYNITSREQSLNWAFPVDANLEEFPLKNEIVRVFKALNRLYYTRKVNLGNHASHQAYFGIKELLSKGSVNTDSDNSLTRSVYVPANTNADDSKLGYYFNKDFIKYRHRHWEGDIIFEGRSGHSIRFGTSWTDPRIHKNSFVATKFNQSPNILISVGPDINTTPTPNVYSGRIVENINTDKTSIWLVSDQIIPLVPATSLSKIHAASIRNYPTVFDGSQIALNSDRIILNSKTDKLLFFGSNGVHIESATDVSLDAERDMISLIKRNKYFEIVGSSRENVGGGKKIWVRGKFIIDVDGGYILHSKTDLDILSSSKISIQSPAVFLGSNNNTSHPSVLGDILISMFKEFIAIHMDNAGMHGISACGSPVTLNKDVTDRLQQLSTKLSTMLSTSVFIGGNLQANESVPPINDVEPIHTVYPELLKE